MEIAYQMEIRGQGVAGSTGGPWPSVSELGSSKTLQGPGVPCGSERGVTVPQQGPGTPSPSARQGGDSGRRWGFPWGHTHDIGVREPQQDPDLRPHDLFVDLESRDRVEVVLPLLPGPSMAPHRAETSLLHPVPPPQA